MQNPGSNVMSLTALGGIGEAMAGQRLSDLLIQGLTHDGYKLADHDVVILAQKIVSKVEGRSITLASVEPSPEARDIATRCAKDPRFVELVLRETSQVVRCVPGILITRHKLGFVMANAGIDQSNLPDADERALLLPENPDLSAENLRRDIGERLGVDVGVLINDSFGRPWREGTCGVCIGSAGLKPLLDMRGDKDRFGRVLKVTQIAMGDELSAAASLMMGQAAEGTPIVVARGLARQYFAQGKTADLIRDPKGDLFGQEKP